MEVTDFNINITSSQSDVLTDWYANVLGLASDEASGGFIVGGAHIFIDGHSETSGATKEPHRVLINMSVDDLAAEQARLEAQGVTFIRKQGREDWGGVISTFLGPDGNYLQMIEFKPGD
ncbi:MAG TPA: VOC family protein [Dehalococcoidia bacterium]|nr:VOC family protein [Dehalococcoidia bacterium]